jgi:hypothetical protein
MKANNFKNILELILLVLLSIICCCLKIISIPDDLISTQFNLLTVSTVFAGFSFTVLGLIISLSDTSVLDSLKETSFLRSYCLIVVRSIAYFLISVVISLYFILEIHIWIESMAKKDITQYTIDIPYILGILFLLLGIILFCKSVYKLVQTMNKNFEINEKKGQDKIKKFQNALSKNKQ